MSYIEMENSMKQNQLFYCITIAVIFFTLGGCMMWPQKDIAPRQVNKPMFKYSILIASRDSEFKNSVVKRVEDHFMKRKVNLKIIGLKQLKNEKPENYTAVVIINSCIAWDFEKKVKKFLKQQTDHKNIIVFTTSGNGNWEPKKKKMNYETISSASKIAKVDNIAKNLIIKVEAFIK